MEGERRTRHLEQHGEDEAYILSEFHSESAGKILLNMHLQNREVCGRYRRANTLRRFQPLPLIYSSGPQAKALQLKVQHSLSKTHGQP